MRHPPPSSTRTSLLALALLTATWGCAPGGGSSPGTGRSVPMSADGGYEADTGVAAPAAEPPPADAGSAATGETCGNGVDDDFDGTIDEGCACTPGDTQACHPDPSVAGVGACALGTQSCVAAGEFGRWSDCGDAGMPGEEICGDGIDEDCDGAVDEDCPTIVEVAVDLDGDCLTARCPGEAPYPVACNIRMDGGDPRGCVASSPTDSVVYFQEGDACGAGHVSGTLSCSSEPGVGLNEANCRINKPTRYYPPNRSGCPDTSG